MIKEGHRAHTRYWGMRTVQKIAKLKEPVKCFSDEVGEVDFSPIIAKLDWDKSPYEDENSFWFPYWVKIGGKEKFGQFAPMIGENALLELLAKAIEDDFFSCEFKTKLKDALVKKDY